MPPRVLTCRPLTAEAYAAYGDVVMAAPRGEPGAPANQGTARRHDRLVALEDRRPGQATPNLSVFRCQPRPSGPFEVALLEKHALSTQVFIPMNARRYLALVALGGDDDRPDLSTLTAFVASGTQGVSYRPGVWHHPMIALDGEIDFACLVWEDGTSDDCTVVSYAPGERAIVEITGG